MHTQSSVEQVGDGVGLGAVVGAIVGAMAAGLWGISPGGALADSPQATHSVSWTLDAAFPGGNIVLDRVEGDHVYLHQDLRDTEGSWFYWYFRVCGAAGRTLTFHFTRGNVVGVRGPAVSTDAGKTWTWLGPTPAKGNTFSYQFGERDAEVRFCVAMPYLEANLREFLARYAGHPALRADRLAVTKKGRPVERLHVGKLDRPASHRVLLTARHHACEMMANWPLEGMIEAVLQEDEVGRWLRHHVEFLAIPFMDKDGVEEGDQGKNRKPHDHNRDYVGPSLYPAVAALRELVPGWSQGRLRLALDLHCPSLRGSGIQRRDEEIFFVGPPSDEHARQLERFAQIVERVQTGPLRYQARNNLPFGREWNTMTEARSCARWAATLPAICFATTIEIPYANAGGSPVTIDSARALGRDLARAICEYLKSLPP